MRAVDNKYEKVLNLLRNSKPVFTDVEAITEKVMRQIQEEKPKFSLTELIVEFLFGWIYIGWVRKSMILASLVIVVFFGYQQALIIKRINDLSGQRIQTGALFKTKMTDDLTNKMLSYRITGKKLSEGKVTVSEKEINEMIRSLNKLQIKYKDIINLIEDDPQLKKYVEDRIKENRKN